MVAQVVEILRTNSWPRCPCSSTWRKKSGTGFMHVLLLGMGGSSLCPGSRADVWKAKWVSGNSMCSIQPIRPRFGLLKTNPDRRVSLFIVEQIGK